MIQLWFCNVFVAVLELGSSFILEFGGGFVLLWFCDGFVFVLTIRLWFCDGFVAVSKCGVGFVSSWFCDGFVRCSLKFHLVLVLSGPQMHVVWRIGFNCLFNLRIDL